MAKQWRALAVVLSVALGLFVAACDSGSVEALAILTDSSIPPDAPDVYEGAGGDDTPAGAGLLPIGGSQPRSIYPIGDLDYVRVNLTAGVTYEFTTGRLSPHGDTKLYLFDTDGSTQVGFNDDYYFDPYGYSSGIVYPAPATGTYYLQAVPYNIFGVTGYTLSAHVFTDADLDGFSSFLDCADTDPNRFPSQVEVAADGIDQNCTGVDGINPGVQDAAEPDDTFATAKALSLETQHEYSYIDDLITYRDNSRSIFPAGDVDHHVFTVPAYSRYEVWLRESSVAASYSIIAADQTTVLSGPFSLGATIPSFASRIYVADNTASGTDLVFYVKVGAGGGGTTGSYVLMLQSMGQDLDGDTFTNSNWAGSWDCNDADPAIHPGATDPPGDGIDWNCNGAD